jgi:hypothetical protein
VILAPSERYVLMSDDESKPLKLKYLDPNYDRFKRSKKHEQRLAKRMGGKRLPRSGGGAWGSQNGLAGWDKTTKQADFTIPDFVSEHKRTVKASMTLERDWLKKVSDGARRAGKDPSLFVTFEEEGKKPLDWVMIPLDVFEQLLAISKKDE